MKPLARADELIVRELPDETLVYDNRFKRAHCLNRTAALVWRRCDGTRTVQDLAVSLHEDLQVPVSDDLVHVALAQLGKARLLQGGCTVPPAEKTYSRRKMLMKLGISLAL